MAQPKLLDAQRADVVVVGGGLAGLACAALAAQSGKKVVLLERARELGGRARTHREGRFLFNLGPHALYRNGPAARLLRELGVQFSGRSPRPLGWLLDEQSCHRMPTSIGTLLRTSCLGWRSKIEVARFLTRLPGISVDGLHLVAVDAWMAENIRGADTRQLLAAFFRLSTYAHAPARQSAAAAIVQLQMALAGNVLYLDEGWQSLVDGLRRVAEQRGVRFVASTPVDRVIVQQNAARAVETRDGHRIAADAVVLAMGPAEVAALLPADADPVLLRSLQTVAPVRAACLTVALHRLTRPRNLFALGLDSPVYYSVHSRYARLTESGSGDVVHVARYLAPDESLPAADVRKQLEAILDRMQPGWRDHIAASQFLPSILVAGALDEADRGGLPGRPAVATNTAGLFLAGDWVGPAGLLADASLASASVAAKLAVDSVVSVGKDICYETARAV